MSFTELDAWLSARAAADEFSSGQYSKGGGNTGVGNMLRHYPAEGLDVVMLSNAERGGLAVVREINRLVPART